MESVPAFDATGERPAKRPREDDSDHPETRISASAMGNEYTAPQLQFRPSLPIPAGTTIPSVQQMLDTLSPTQMRSVLATTISADLTYCALSCLTDCWTQKLRAEQARVIDFDDCSKEVWHTLNTKYRKLSGSKQYDMSFDAFESVTGSIESIQSQVTRSSSYGTKLSALETLRKIGKSILLSNDCLGSEVRKLFGHDSSYVDAMMHIVECMSDEERFAAGRNVSEAGKGELRDKIDWVAKDAAGYCIFEGLEEVLDLLDGVEDEEDDDGEEDEDGEEANEKVHGPANREVITIDGDD
ncbi:hypothetical protein AC578_7000 [Pseudocercospora eumusae]|uniref:Uncharacterized protein n=1 Tax=Pseudocercospora eumusae TaxID=321146 RepID=A0A139HCP1_9PEZI|nr:hypothetical protein AC578_7000 [Pseudocercospora eumusae]